MLRTIALLVVALTTLAAPGGGGVLSNQLAGHASPYLAMHAEDPVAWQLWNADTLQKARALNRPLLISVGYFACHWCHVMQRESYRDAVVAQLLNAHFIPVKVDRELEPALDAHLMEFVELTRGQAGWPLNVFLTPDGYPVFGIVYEPPERFRTVLEELHRRWSADPRQLAGAAQNAMQEWRALRAATPRAVSPGISFAQSLQAQLSARRDELAGGFGHTSKFPMAPQLEAVLRLVAAGADASLEEFLHLTLDQMAQQGLRDLLGGGFFRYTVDPGWEVPHYEKMLYDNAQLALLYLRAGRELGAPQYRAVGLDTLDFMLREMLTPEGYFISSLSAVDAEGREGFYYLWDAASLERTLNEQELHAVRAAWFSGRAEDSEYGSLPRRQQSGAALAHALGWSQQQLESTLASARTKLLRQRSRRSLPADGKGIAAWNGLALSALAAAHASTGGDRYGEHADRLAAYIATRLWDGTQLARARAERGVLAPASLEDYALVARGLWDWTRQKPDSDHLALVEQLLRCAWQRYFADGRWVDSDTPLIPMLGGRIASEDAPLPSASAIIAALSRSHPALKADAGIQKQLARHLQQVRESLGDAAFWYPDYLVLLGPDQSRP